MTFNHHTALAAALLLAGVINALPFIGVLGAERLQALYAMPFDDANLRILMRHRAVLFGLLGGAMIAAVFIPHWRTPMAVAGLISMVSFIAISTMEGGSSEAIRRVVLADVIASLLLAAALLWARR